jgi:hypothetical protein
MSTNNRIRVMIGLTVLGSFGWATVRDHADADEPRESIPRSTVAPPGPERYLLLTDGRVIKGVITEDETQYSVSRSIGVMRFRKPIAEGAFNTLREAYLYRLEQLPERDFDERMKLARWCLNWHLKAEAREQLEQVLAINAKHPQAKAMLFSMEQDAAIVAQRQRDPDVKQAGAETMAEKGPSALDTAVIHRAQRGLNIATMPVIFDLPTPLAIKRTTEFFRFVHPVLQRYCAKCHDGNYEGEFQLVPIARRGDSSPEALRANLDAALRLIDQENPSKSELLTSTLRAHGRGPRPRSIFPGSNDMTYQILATWVQSLRNPKHGGDASAAMPRGTESTETFAQGRGRIAGDTPESTGAAFATTGVDQRPAASGSARSQMPRPSQFGLGGAGGPNGQVQAAPDDFPLPFVLTGKMPNPTTTPGKAARSAQTIAPAASAPAHPAIPPPKSPIAAGKASNPAETADTPAAPKKKSKPVTIDPSLLERALQNRNNPH